MIEIKTECGIAIHVLPEDAKCKLTGLSPEKMDECPCLNSWGAGICIPDICSEYAEENA